MRGTQLSPKLQKIVSEGETSSRCSLPRAGRNQDHSYRPGTICEDDPDEGFYGASADKVLHLFIVDIRNCFIALANDEVGELDGTQRRDFGPYNCEFKIFIWRSCAHFEWLR